MIRDMARILVSGLINIETTLRVEQFPIPYFPVTYPFHGIGSSVSGVGYNVAKALTTLGHDVRFLSLVGQDVAALQVREALRTDGIDDRFILSPLKQTAQSVILYEPSGRRQIHVDLKDIQECMLPPAVFEEAAEACDLAVLCNINFSRPLLQAALSRGLTVATDVHALSSLDDAYNRDFLESADILFMSHENLPVSAGDMVKSILSRFRARIVVIGQGSAGALVGRRGHDTALVPAVSVRPIVSTIGAGDALFSAFIHGHVSGLDPETSLRRAAVFAAWKIGESSASRGFLNAAGLDAMCKAGC